MLGVFIGKIFEFYNEQKKELNGMSVDKNL